MGFPSKFDGKCKDCGTVHKIGDQIEKNANEHWCINGKNCQGTMQTQGSVPTPPSSATPFKREHVTNEEEIIWNSILDKLIEFDILADKRLAENTFFDNSNPAHNGQVKNFAFAVYQEFKKREVLESQRKAREDP